MMESTMEHDRTCQHPGCKNHGTIVARDIREIKPIGAQQQFEAAGDWKWGCRLHPVKSITTYLDGSSDDRTFPLTNEDEGVVVWKQPAHGTPMQTPTPVLEIEDESDESES